MRYLFSAIACYMALAGSAQNIEPSQYCGTGTIWSESSQKCVAQPAALQAYDGNLDGCVNVSDLLGLLSIFGECEPEGQSIYWFGQNAEGWPYATGSFLDPTTQFYIQDCLIDSGYFLTTDLNMALEFVLESGDSIEWCSDGLHYPVMSIDSLQNIRSISQDEIPNFSIVFDQSDVGTGYLALPQSFDENELLLQTPYFQHSVFGLSSNFIFSERRSCIIHGIEYWLYGGPGYQGFNVICGY